ncbi:hypothetical protein [Vibrio fluvialis]|uniref:hypothetical protein n=1 Tax=Vibrio fluvialis TaxID=676 RepID=UPI003999C977
MYKLAVVLARAIELGLDCLGSKWAKEKRQQREASLNDIKADPNAANAERFGSSSGRVSIKPGKQSE